MKAWEVTSPGPSQPPSAEAGTVPEPGEVLVQVRTGGAGPICTLSKVISPRPPKQCCSRPRDRRNRHCAAPIRCSTSERESDGLRWAPGAVDSARGAMRTVPCSCPRATTTTEATRSSW